MRFTAKCPLEAQCNRLPPVAARKLRQMHCEVLQSLRCLTTGGFIAHQLVTQYGRFPRRICTSAGASDSLRVSLTESLTEAGTSAKTERGCAADTPHLNDHTSLKPTLHPKLALNPRIAVDTRLKPGLTKPHGRSWFRNVTRPLFNTFAAASLVVALLGRRAKRH